MLSSLASVTKFQLKEQSRQSILAQMDTNTQLKKQQGHSAL